MKNNHIADLTPRVVGGLIDVIIIMISGFAVMFIWGFISGASGELAYLSSEQLDALWRGRAILIYLIIDIIYTIGLQAGSNGATFGQKSMGLRLVTVKYEKPTLGALILRYFMSLVSSIFLKIGFLIALFSDKKQTLHDMVAGTIVVHTSGDSKPYKTHSANNESNLNTQRASAAPLNTKPATVVASVQASTSQPLNDEIYYERALDEFDSNRRKGLWIKLLTQNEGDEVKSKFQYIKARAQEIQATNEKDLTNDICEVLTCRKCSQRIRVANKTGMIKCPSCAHSWLFEKIDNSAALNYNDEAFSNESKNNNLQDSFAKFINLILWCIFFFVPVFFLLVALFYM